MNTDVKTCNPLKPVCSGRAARNLQWAERELLKMQYEEADPQLRALWSTAARIARERIAVKTQNEKGQR